MATPARKPNSRETREPRRTKSGKAKEADVTERDRKIWQRVFVDCGYPLVRLDVIHAFMGEEGGDYKSLSKHYDSLSREPNLYVYRHPAQWDRRSYSRSAVYGLDRKGFDTLRVEAYSPPRQDEFEHELMWCEFQQNVHLGALKHARPFAGRFEILNSEHCPAATRALSNPFEIAVIRHNKFPGTAEADGPLFGVPVVTDSGDHWRFFFVQADTDKMPIVREDDKQSSIDRHFRDAIYIIKNRLAQERFGIPEGELYFIFITTGLTHLSNMKKRLNEITEKQKWLREYFLFKDFPTHKFEQRPTTVSGDMFTTLYDRVEYKPFSFLTMEG